MPSAALPLVSHHFCVSIFIVWQVPYIALLFLFILSTLAYYHDVRFIYPASFVHAFRGLLSCECSFLCSQFLCLTSAMAYYRHVRFIYPASFVQAIRGLPVVSDHFCVHNFCVWQVPCPITITCVSYTRLAKFKENKNNSICKERYWACVFDKFRARLPSRAFHIHG